MSNTHKHEEDWYGNCYECGLNPLKPQANTLDTVKQGYMCLYCSDSIATIKCKHDYVKDTTDHVLLCENCHNDVWGGETCEQETA